VVGLGTQIRRTAARFPLRDTIKRNPDLARQFENLVRNSRQHLGTKHYDRRAESTESDAPNAEEGHPYSRQPTKGEDSAVRKSGRSYAYGSVSYRRPVEYSRPLNAAPESTWNLDLIYALPEAFTQAKVLTHLGLDFKKESQHFVFAKGLDKAKLSTIIRMTEKLSVLEELREITCVRLGAASTVLGKQNWQRDGLGPTPVKTVAQDIWAQLVPPDVSVFDERVLVQTSSSITSEALQSRLSKWKIESIPHASVQMNHVDGYSPELDARAFSELFGCTDSKFPNEMTGEEESINLTPSSMFNFALNGLGIMLTTAKVNKSSSELLEAEGRLSAATYHLATSIHRSVELAAHLPAKVFLNSLTRSFSQLSKTLRTLVSYGITIEKVYEIGRTKDAVEYSTALEHMVTAVLLATIAWGELEDCSKVVETEVVRRKYAMVNASSEEFHRLDYERVRECCSDIFLATDSLEGSGTTGAEWQKRFQNGVDRLGELGWGKDAASIIIRNECRWKRVLHHTSTANSMIESSFIAALSANPAKSIRRKAAALPTDLVALLMSRVLWRPVIGDQDTLDMYNQYITDLVSHDKSPLDGNRLTEASQGVKHLHR